MQPTITFYNRAGKLYLRINLGESNKKYERSCGIDIGSLEVVKHRTERGDICRVEGYSRPAVRANSFIQKWEEVFEQAASPEEAILLWEKEKDAARENRLAFQQMLDEYIREKCNGWSNSTLKNFMHVSQKYAAYCSGDDFNVYSVDIKALEPHNRRPVIRNMKAHWKGFSDYLYEELDHSIGTIYLFFTKLSEVIRNADAEYGIEIPFPYRPDNADYEAKKVDWPDWVTRGILSLPDTGFYPVFKAQIWTTLRISDLFQVSDKNFENFEVDGRNIWRIVNVNQKTSTPVTPCLPENVALRLLDNIQKYGHVVPSEATNLTTYNRNLKWAVEKVAGKETIKIVGDKGVKEVLISGTASSHQLRKEGINLYERAGFSSKDIMGLFSGHKTDATYQKFYKNPLRSGSLVKFADFQTRMSVRLIDSERDA